MMVSAVLRLFVHVEEPSMKETIDALLPGRLEGRDVELKVIDHGSKQSLLRNLPNRMKAYANWPDPGLRILVLVDRDDEDCQDLKRRLEAAASSAGLPTKTAPDTNKSFKVVNRIVVEELEAWFLGDVPALVAAFPRVSASLGQQARYRDPDAVPGGTWEALRRILIRSGYYAGSRHLPKIEVARRVAPLMVASRNRSRSFRAFVDGLDALLAI
jgi:hypothetical protein